ncbi:MAG: D-alanyl-D-alanine carboxypeptidase [Synechococcales bacterium]|nr:D-alanyl-D-alanine carboxypeptidase [Synechococcales bacterium]
MLPSLLLMFNLFGEPELLQMKPMNLADAIGLAELQDTPWMTLLGETDAGAEAIVRQYLSQLAAQGLNVNEQSVWLQAGPVLLVNHQGQTPLSAASLTKVATSLAALQTWGPDHQFDTLIGATSPVQDGVLQGDLIVQGTGDPLFVWEEAIAVGNALNRMGIRQVTGDLVLTSNFFMNFEFNPMKSGAMLKQALNSQQWQAAVTEQYASMKPQPARPQLVVNGNVRYSEQPVPMRTLLRHKSLPMIHLVKKLNVYSNNVMSEALSRLMGGAQVTAERAAAASGAPLQELLLANGSGLGVENRLSSYAVTQMLGALARFAHSRQMTIADLFPISGTDVGTLIDRDIPRNAVVKTGTLNEVSALAGVLPTRDRGLIWFSIINRGTNIEGLRAQQDVLLHQLQTHWGKPEQRASAITPSPWINNPNTLIGAEGRNEVVSGG